MNLLLEKIRDHALKSSANSVITDGIRNYSYTDLLSRVEHLASQLQQHEIKTLGLYADNGLGWVIADLAAMSAGLRCVPLPRFFSDAQLQHATSDSGLDAILTPDSEPRAKSVLHSSIINRSPIEIAEENWQLLKLNIDRQVDLPVNTQKITYTSGTTGSPKGVCLSVDDMLSVAYSLSTASGANTDDRHLCVLPLSTLLENLGGIYAPLIAGASICVPAQEGVGMNGATGLDTAQLLKALHHYKASTTILVPQILLALVSAGEMGAPRPKLRFAAVGGAPVSARLLERARNLGLPVFEGYGLSECSSVVSLNTPSAHSEGSVGQVLPHVHVQIADDGEIMVRGTGYLGYAGGAARNRDEWIATGDLGHIDSNGYLFVSGRKKNMFITAFGRNVAPEWIERELTQHAVVAHAAVFGEGRPWNSAVLASRILPGQDTEAALNAAVESANRELPDYARIHRWIFAGKPFSVEDGLLTTNGRVRRDGVLAHYRTELDSLYLETIA